jgi:ribosomal-protein-serine acetyltransferase
VFTCPLDDERELRLLEERDADELYEAIERNRDYLAAWMPWPRGQTRAGTLEFIEASRRQFADNDGFSAAIVDRGRIVGTIGFHAVSWADRSTSIGYWLDEREQGRGTMTRAVAALVDHAFDRWALNRVEIRVAVDNARSRAIPERLGFQLEGTLRQAQRVGDSFLDNVVYALLAENWRRGGGWPSSEPVRRPR